MNRKFAAFALMVTVVGAVPYFAWDRPASDVSPALYETLLPTVVGNYRLGQRWRNSLVAGIVEWGGLYTDGAAGKGVLLDLFSGTFRSHTGLACYMVSGSTLHWQHLTRVKTADTSAVFNLALVSDDHTWRLVGNTQCRGGGCDDEELRAWSRILPRSILAGFLRPVEMPVPVTITIAVARESNSPGPPVPMEAEMLQRFNRFAAGLDLLPMRRLAAAQSDEFAQ